MGNTATFAFANLNWQGRASSGPWQLCVTAADSSPTSSISRLGWGPWRHGLRLHHRYDGDSGQPIAAIPNQFLTSAASQDASELQISTSLPLTDPWPSNSCARRASLSGIRSAIIGLIFLS